MMKYVTSRALVSNDSNEVKLPKCRHGVFLKYLTGVSPLCTNWSGFELCMAFDPRTPRLVSPLAMVSASRRRVTRRIWEVPAVEVKSIENTAYMI